MSLLLSVLVLGLAGAPALADEPAPAAAAETKLQLRSPKPGVVVSAWTGAAPSPLPKVSRDVYRADGLEVLCTTPCTATLPAGPTTLVAHGARWSTASQELALPAGSATVLAAPHSRTRHTLASGLTGAGFGLAAFGTGLLLFNQIGPQTIDTSATGFVLGGAGLASLGTGLTLRFAGKPSITLAD